MATKKTDAPEKKPEAKKKAEPKKQKDTVTYRNKEFMVLEKTETQYKLTDGVIHFWANAKDVKAD